MSSFKVKVLVVFLSHKSTRPVHLKTWTIQCYSWTILPGTTLSALNVLRDKYLVQVYKPAPLLLLLHLRPRPMLLSQLAS